MDAKKMSFRKALLLALLPLSAVFPVLLRINAAGRILILAFAAISLLYSIPPIRLKKRFGFIYSPLCALIIFFESFIVSGSLNVDIFFLSIMILALHVYAEAIHYLRDEEAGAVRIRAFRIFRLIPVLTFVLGIIFSFYNPIFLAAPLFSLSRLWAGRNLNTDYDFKKIHGRTWSGVYSVYEFAVYAVCGLGGGFMK